MIDSGSSDRTGADAVSGAEPSGADATGTYVYCLVRSHRTPDLDGAGPGLPDASSPRLLEAGDDLWLVVADVDLGRYGAAAIEARLEDLEWVAERALGHERVVGHWVSDLDVVPMKLFTIFAGDDRALAHVAGDRSRIDRILARIGGRVEWGVRVHLDRDALERAIDESERDRAGAGESPGRAFLMGKKRRVEGARAAAIEARAAADAAYEEIAGIAEEAVRNPEQTGTALLMEADFLVAAEARGRLEQAVERCARRLREVHCEVTLTGPWPAYHFVAGSAEGESA